MTTTTPGPDPSPNADADAPPRDPRQAAELAIEAYDHAYAGRLQEAADVVGRIGEQCGGGGLTTALATWCRKYVAHATDGDKRRLGIPQMVFINDDTGEATDEQSTQVPANIRWAGQLIAAYAARDLERCNAVIDELPQDEGDIGMYILSVLFSIASTVKNLPRGFAEITRPGR
jgi:hypothetical protein